VFHAIPDDLITTWKQYKEFIIHHERLNKPLKDETKPDPVARMPSEAGDMGAPQEQPTDHSHPSEPVPKVKEISDDGADVNGTSNGTGAKDQDKRKQAKGPEPFDQAERDEMERLLEDVRGHLVLYPTRFLEGEDFSNNFLFNADRILPLPIYD